MCYIVEQYLIHQNHHPTTTSLSIVIIIIPDSVDANACLFSVNPISDNTSSHAVCNRLPYIPFMDSWMDMMNK